MLNIQQDQQPTKQMSRLYGLMIFPEPEIRFRGRPHL